MIGSTHSRLARLGAVAAVLAGIAACEPNRALSSDPTGSPAYGKAFRVEASNLPHGTAAFVFADASVSSVDTLRLTLQGLDTLENGFYTVWVGNSPGTALRRATGTLTVVRTDTVIDPVTGDPTGQPHTFTFNNVSSFKNGGPANTAVFTTTRAQSGVPAADKFDFVLITIEETANATTPHATRRPLWADQSEGVEDVTPLPDELDAVFSDFNFGHWSIAPESLYVFNPQGHGKVSVRDNLLLVNDSGLTRPPLGYYYATFAIKRDSANLPTDTVFLGVQTSPFPRRQTVLLDADSLIVDPLVQTNVPPEILAAANMLRVDGVGRKAFQDFSDVYVTLESKNKTLGRMGPAVVLHSVLPTIVRNGGS